MKIPKHVRQRCLTVTDAGQNQKGCPEITGMPREARM